MYRPLWRELYSYAVQDAPSATLSLPSSLPPPLPTRKQFKLFRFFVGYMSYGGRDIGQCAVVFKTVGDLLEFTLQENPKCRFLVCGGKYLNLFSVNYLLPSLETVATKDGLPLSSPGRGFWISALLSGGYISSRGPINQIAEFACPWSMKQSLF